eukprot:CAMPEP_0114557872 /NCGR_PEP_ID=MMETSP0114-20121206/10066_1 /TAXON_ID=31324 /ORGANISM="Goniomonas sp, Strain m" /LENGTH=436 /DNA_ID=CAMNT_0001743197 /DNA_START=43 /DNA_END=1353 /DNA_ORIENTATION=+
MAATASAEYDLLPVLAKYMDRHLVFPLLEHVQKLNIYSKEDCLRGELELLSKTNLIDYEIDKHKELNKVDDAPQALKARRTAVVAELKTLKEACEPLLKIVENQALMKQLRTEKLLTSQYLAENHQITAEHIEGLFAYGKFMFECGHYEQAAEYLPIVRSLGISSGDKQLSALWGKLASEILLSKHWDVALDDINRIREYLDAKPLTSQVVLLEHRTWLIHWSLFVFFEHRSGRDHIIDMFFQERYLQTIQINCPHILRYLTAAVIVNKRRRAVLTDLVRIIQQETHTYRDPICEFVECVLVNFDFEAAQVKLRECEKVLKTDYFLEKLHDEFIDNARLLIFKTYCQIHQCVDIGMLAEKLNMDQAAAELWIANLIRNAGLDAKIDSAKNTVIMGTTQPSVYQQVIEKTKGLSFRSYVLTSNLERRRVVKEGEDEE